MDTPITHGALRAIRRLLRAADRGERKLAAATGLTPSQLLVLQEVERRGEITPGAVATTLQFGQATVTNIVDRLEAMVLVSRRRSDRDKRRVLLHVTQHGEEMLRAAPDLLHNRFQERFVTLADWEQAMILAALERLNDLLDARDIDAAPLIDAGPIDRSLLAGGHPPAPGNRDPAA
ncbi:MAG TPA: MarR family winged helix-turn-helix transcriptional regulator [Sphingomonadaceae bacterium]|nr:MarR family winged helix-turn-helix transcriptional regulator [Sphingomonadaceae bacterium]